MRFGLNFTNVKTVLKTDINYLKVFKNLYKKNRLYLISPTKIFE